jgi:hypothetical protein
MAEVKVILIIETNNVEETTRCVNKYLQESLENDFIQGGEEIISVTVEE